MASGSELRAPKVKLRAESFRAGRAGTCRIAGAHQTHGPSGLKAPLWAADALTANPQCATITSPVPAAGCADGHCPHDARSAAGNNDVLAGVS